MSFESDYYINEASVKLDRGVLKKCIFKRRLINDKLSFVLPFSTQQLEEHHLDAESPEDAESMRLKIALLSFVKSFNIADLCEFLIISPPFNTRHAEMILRSVTHDERFKVISELEICPELSKSQDSGWNKQQLVKLAACDVVRTSHYITLDSDVVCVRKFSFNDVIRKGKALCQVEGIKDYLRLYHDYFAGVEYYIKINRSLSAVRTLGFNRPVSYRDRVYSETPVIMNTRGVGLLTQYLQNKYNVTWREYLAKRFDSWTEYPLYFQFLEGAGLLEQMYTISKKKKLWDLSKSLWQPEHRYRNKRIYDNIDEYLRGVNGYFIVLQTRVSSGNFFNKLARKIQGSRWNPR